MKHPCNSLVACVFLSTAAASSAAGQEFPFGAPVTLPGPLGDPTNSKLVDVNLDGHIDLAVAAIQGRRVRIALGRGDGTFFPAMEVLNVVPAGQDDSTATAGFDIANVDADPEPEIVVRRNDGEVWLYEQDSEPSEPLSFDEGTLIQSVDATLWSLVQIVDVDGDGMVDIALHPYQTRGAPAWLRGAPGGVFAPATLALPQGFSAIYSEFFDADADGDLDLVATSERLVNAPTFACVVYRNEGAFPLRRASSVSLPVGGPGGLELVQSLVVADANADGVPDVVTAGSYANEIQVHIGSGSALSFATSQVPLNLTPRKVAVGDFDGDGLRDLAAGSRNASPSGAYIEVARGLGGSTFDAALPVSDAEAKVTRLLSDDLNSDGRADLVRLRVGPVSFGGREGADVFLGTGSSTTPLAPTAPVGEMLSAYTMQHADYDHDGIPDLVCREHETYRVVGKRGLGGGRFGEFETLIGGMNRAVAVADVNGDGLLDVLASGFDFFDRDVRVAYNLGGGVFSPASLVAESSLGTTSEILVHDVNSDGLADVAVRGGNKVEVFFALSTGVFDEPAELYAGTNGSLGGMAFTDLDGDGTDDLVVHTWSELFVKVGMGNGAFQPEVELMPSSTLLYGLDVVVDVDEDGLRDIVFSTSLGGGLYEVSWARNLGGFSFGAATAILPTSGWSAATDFQDFDLDGSLDLLVVLRDSPPELAFLRGLGLGQFEAGITASSNEGSIYSVEFADVDSDGDLDLTTLTNGRPNGNPEVNIHVSTNLTLGPVGDVACSATVANSTGAPGRLSLQGSDRIAVNSLTLVGSSLPTNATVLALTSRTVGQGTTPPGSVGTLCLGGAIGRFVGPGEIQNSGGSGSAQLSVDVTSLPTPQLGGVAAQVGETWTFQLWHRDAVAGTATSNLTDAVTVAFR